MRVPDSILDRYGQPESISGRWATFFHRCAPEGNVGGGKAYPMLLYNCESGWVKCKACGHKARGARSDDSTGMIHQGPNLEEASQAARESLGEATMPILKDSEAGRYLMEGRGFTWEELQYYGVLEGRPGWRRFKDYAIFPLFHEGELVSWHARDADIKTRRLPDGHTHRGWVDSREPRKRWLSPSYEEGLWSRRQCWWGLNRIEKGDVAYICEGIMDAAYFGSGAAYMGPIPTEVQVAQLLDREPSAIYVAADFDMDRDLIVKAIKAKDKYITVDHDPRDQCGPSRLSTDYPDYGSLLARGLRYSPQYGETSTAHRNEMWWLDLED